MGLAQCLAAAFLFLLLLGLTAAQRVVTVQKGPLYRTEGSHVTLWCKVSGYQGPAEQNFQWSIYLPSAPEREVQIVSTVDPSFPYAIYTQRVRGRGIFVERLRGDAVLLHITELQERDAGQYECHTPNTDERYFGSYSAKMDLAVIPDTLSASMAPQALTLMEGDAVELTCEVSKSTAQHTHLSVGWYLLQGAGEHHAEEILTLSKDFILKPGPSYEQRFLQGAVQLNKVGNTTYKLLIGGVTPSDQGQLYCEAAEWIEDPDGTWKDISRKQTARTSLAVVSQESKLQVATKDSSVETASGNAAIECRIVFAQNNSQFAVTWYLLPPLADAMPLQILRADYSSVLEYGSEFSSPAQKSRFLSQRVSSSIFQLHILSANLADQGGYYCVVEEWLWLVDGWYKLGEGTSGRTMLKFKHPDPEPRLDKTNHSVSAREGEEVTLPCRLQGALPPGTHLSATWFQVKSGGRDAALLTVHRDGSTEYPGQRRAGRLQLRRPSAGDFSLTLGAVQSGDAGAYYCQLQGWQQHGHDQGWALRASARSGYTQLITAPPESTVLSRICSSPPLLNFILFLPLVLILLLALVVFCWYCKHRKSKKGNMTGWMMELEGNEEVKKT